MRKFYYFLKLKKKNLKEEKKRAPIPEKLHKQVLQASGIEELQITEAEIVLVLSSQVTRRTINHTRNHVANWK